MYRWHIGRVEITRTHAHQIYWKHKQFPNTSHVQKHDYSFSMGVIYLVLMPDLTNLNGDAHRCLQ